MRVQRRFWKSLLTFFLVLALTVGTVATLSMATAAKTETAPARYSQEVRESQAQPAVELSAVIPEEVSSPFASIGAFLLVMAVSALAVFLSLRSFQKSRKVGADRGYGPGSDRTFQNGRGVRRISVK